MLIDIRLQWKLQLSLLNLSTYPVLASGMQVLPKIISMYIFVHKWNKTFEKWLKKSYCEDKFHATSRPLRTAGPYIPNIYLPTPLCSRQQKSLGLYPFLVVRTLPLQPATVAVLASSFHHNPKRVERERERNEKKDIMEAKNAKLGMSNRERGSLSVCGWMRVCVCARLYDWVRGCVWV